MISNICDDTLWDGNIVTCPICDQPAILLGHRGTDYKGEPCPAYWVVHTTAKGNVTCEVRFDTNTGETRIVKTPVRKEGGP